MKELIEKYKKLVRLLIDEEERLKVTKRKDEDCEKCHYYVYAERPNKEETWEFCTYDCDEGTYAFWIELHAIEECPKKLRELEEKCEKLEKQLKIFNIAGD